MIKSLVLEPKFVVRIIKIVEKDPLGLSKLYNPFVPQHVQ